MANFLESLGLSFVNAGTDVYVNVTITNFIEMATIDAHNNIKSYAQVPIEYNDSQREISKYQQLQIALERLFIEINVNPQKANIHMCMPMVWFGYKDSLPLLLDDNAITNVVLGELEQTYIFKRKDPIPYWFDALVSTKSDSRSVFFTAIQEETKNEIQSVVKNIGANLVSLECSLFADLKGLLKTEIAKEQMETENYNWNLMLVNNNGFQMFGLQGKKILEYYEEPLAMKSYEGEELYTTIDNAAQIALMSSPSNAIVIISQTDLVSSEILSKHLQFNGSIISVEDNKFKKDPLMDFSLDITPEKQSKISLTLIGSCAEENLIPIYVNFLKVGDEDNSVDDIVEIPIAEGKTIVLTPQKATLYSIILLVAITVPMLLGWGISSIIDRNMTQQVEDLDSQIEKVDKQLKEFEDKQGQDNFDPVKEIERVLKNNRTKIMAFASLGESIPKNLYLTYFMTGEDGMIDIQGCADSVEDVYVFFQNMKDYLVESKLRLSKLDLKAGSLESVINSGESAMDDAPYVFEITNMDESQLASFMNALSGKKEPDQKAPAANADQAQAAKNQEAAKQPVQQPKNNPLGKIIPGLNNTTNQVPIEE